MEARVVKFLGCCSLAVELIDLIHTPSNMTKYIAHGILNQLCFAFRSAFPLMRHRVAVDEPKICLEPKWLQMNAVGAGHLSM